VALVDLEAAMRRSSPGNNQRWELMRRLDRVADEVNPFLIILMVGLLILNLIRLFTMVLPNFPITRVDPSCMVSRPSATIGGARTVEWPG
jgi:hypothetical protein